MLVKRRALALAMLILALTAGTALAAAVSGDGTLIGTSGPDSIHAGQGNDTVYGLAGADSISAGNGNDVIDGDGLCGPGVKSGDYPHGLPAGEYCEHGQIAGDGGDSISAGNGNDTIFAGGGKNSIAVGCGDDTIYGGPLGDSISAGASKGCQADDQIYLGRGSSYHGSSVATGNGNDVIHAQNGVKDTISCLKPNGTKVYADRSDSVSGCAQVIFTPDPNPGPNPLPAHDRRSVKHLKHHRLTKHHRVQSA